MTENETIERCDLLINSLSVDNGVTNAFCDRSKGYVTFEKMREFTKSCKKALENQKTMECMLEKAAEEIEKIYGRETELSEEIRDLLDCLN